MRKILPALALCAMLTLAACHTATAGDAPPLRETYWKLVELNGRTIGPQPRDIHIILKQEHNRVIGSGGCNRLDGAYDHRQPDKLRFTQIAATEMACMDSMAYESEFFRTLEQSARYDLRDGSLILRAADNTHLARFVPVYLY